MSRLLWALREHLHFLVIAPILIVVMTYPTIQHVFDTEVFWLPTVVYDVWTNIWNAWYAELILAGEANLLYTDLMFYPDGVSLGFHSFSLPHVVTLSALNAILPLSNAYNLTYLLIIFVTTLSAYIYLLYLFRLKWVCLFGAIVFGCSIYVTGRPSQPLVSTIATIPLTLYFLHRAILEKRWSLVAVAGFLAGATAFIGIYTYVCLIMALGLFLLYFARHRWRHPGFWLQVSVLLAIAGSIGLLRAYPMLRDADSLEFALEKYRGESFNSELLQYFVNLDHPITTPIFRDIFELEIDPRFNTSYLGYIPLALIILGFTRAAYRRKMLFWLYLMLPFLILRLGTALTINGERYDTIVLPKQILDNLIPSIFTAIYSPDYFYCGALLPLAVLSCYGAMTFLRLFSHRMRGTIIAMLILGLAFEYYISLESTVISDEQFAYLEWLAEEDDQDDIRLINVPMGRVNSKLYDFYQTLSGYPHVEGVAGRTPPAAYDYINNNLLLSAWSGNKSIRCQFSNQAQYLGAIAALESDGFTHVVMHHEAFFASKVEDSFAFADAAFQNGFNAIYRLSDLRRSCPDEMPGHEAATHLKDFFMQAATAPKRTESILSLHPSRPLTAALLRFYSAEAARWKSLIHVSQDARGQALVQSSDARTANLDSIVERNSIIWLVYDPQETDVQRIAVFNDWLVQHYKECSRDYDNFHIRSERKIRREFPCELVAEEAELSIRYDNGIRLANRLYNVTENELQVYLWWSDARGGDHAFSIQIFDADGVKVAQASDRVIRFDPLALRSVDISQLPPGTYSARLIVYHVDSKQSQPGTIVESQHAFPRELEIARFTIPA